MAELGPDLGEVAKLGPELEVVADLVPKPGAMDELANSVAVIEIFVGV